MINKDNFVNYDVSFISSKKEIYAIMDEYAKAVAFDFYKFKADYTRIEQMNHNHSLSKEGLRPTSITWRGAPDEIIWEAYLKGEQLKRYFEVESPDKP